MRTTCPHLLTWTSHLYYIVLFWWVPGQRNNYLQCFSFKKQNLFHFTHWRISLPYSWCTSIWVDSIPFFILKTKASASKPPSLSHAICDSTHHKSYRQRAKYETVCTVPMVTHRIQWLELGLLPFLLVSIWSSACTRKTIKTWSELSNRYSILVIDHLLYIAQIWGEDVYGSIYFLITF